LTVRKTPIASGNHDLSWAWRACAMGLLLGKEPLDAYPCGAYSSAIQCSPIRLTHQKVAAGFNSEGWL
jgi:hypothetical protein